LNSALVEKRQAEKVPTGMSQGDALACILPAISDSSPDEYDEAVIDVVSSIDSLP
jgi:hypothetical protein